MDQRGGPLSPRVYAGTIHYQTQSVNSSSVFLFIDEHRQEKYVIEDTEHQKGHCEAVSLQHSLNILLKTASDIDASDDGGAGTVHETVSASE